MKLKTFSFTGTHKRTGQTKEFQITASDRKAAFAIVQQKFQQDFEFNFYARG